MTKSAGISARVTEATKDRLDDYAAASGLPKSEIIEAAINNYLDVIQDVTQDEQDEQVASKFSNIDDRQYLPTANNPASEFSNSYDHTNLPVTDTAQEKQATVIADLIARIEKLEATAITQQHLDERLAMATAPLWDAIHDATQDVIQSTDDVTQNATQDVIQPTDNAIQNATQDVIQLTDNAIQNATQDVTQDVTQSTDDATQELSKDDPLIETSLAPIKDEPSVTNDPSVEIKLLIADQAKYWEEVADSSYAKQAREIASFLISNGFKDEGYQMSSGYIAQWRKGKSPFPSTPKSKHYLASIVYQEGIMGNLK